MKDFLILRLLDKIRFLFVKMDIDYSIMRLILQMKMTMDDRRVPTLYNQSSKKEKETKNGYIKSLWIYVLISLLFIPLIIFGENFIFQMSITYSIILFLIMTSMIADFSSVLLDVRDRSILSTKPITSKTLNAAKFMHILIYLSYLTIALTAIPLIVALFKQGLLFFILTIFELGLINIFIVVITALLYLIILRFFDGEKLKDIINYVQIGLSLFLMVGYQFVGRSFQLVNLDVIVDIKWWSFFLVPMWFAAPYELLLNNHQSAEIIIFSLLALIMPMLSIWLYIKLIPTFERNLQKLLNTSKSKKVKNNPLKKLLLKLICKTKEERTFYQFSTLMMKQEREYKLKVYPVLGFALVIPFIFLFNISSFETVDYSVSMRYLNVYFSMLLIPTAVFMLEYSGSYKGAWIYKVFPINDYTDFKKGSLKAFIIQLYLPIYIILSIVFTFIFGTRIILDLLSILVASCIYTVVCYISHGSKIPFTKPSNEQSNEHAWKSFVLMIPVAILAGIHYLFATHIPYGKVIFLIILVLVNYGIWKIVFKRTL